MDEDAIVAVYDTVAHAELAIADLRQAGVPESAISRHTSEAVTGTSAVTWPAKEEGFWSRLFGGEPDRDATVYSRSVENGASVVTVKIGAEHAERVMEILDSHRPIDIDERAAAYAVHDSVLSAPTAGTYGQQPTYALDSRAAATSSGDETLRLSEERLAVGKRLVNRGGTRIRRFVVETPAEAAVSLREERVTLERRPVTESRPVTDADFTDRTIEMTETAEEAVVSKTAFVTEEIRLRKETTERVETIRDTVRKEDVEIEQIPAGAATTKPYDPAR